MDIHEIAPGVTRRSDGLWSTGEVSAVTYPEGGHDFCAGVEDQSFWFAHRNRAILEAVRRFPPCGGPLFDVGAGNGYVALALQRAEVATIAIEPSAAGALTAVKRGVVHVIHGALPSEAFRHASAGGIGLFDVIEHVEHDQEWLRSLRPYVQSGGRLYVTTPAYRWLWSDIDVQSGHYRRYSLPELRKVVESAGFELEYATYIFWCIPPLMLLARRFRRPAPPSAGEHTVGGPATRALVRYLFAWETALIRRGWPLPFGGTCLLVARNAQV